MNYYSKLLAFVLLGVLFNTSVTYSQEKKKEDTYAGLKFRSLGPALNSGRIADIAIHPENENVMYVAVGSGGVWKTENAGTTWTPIFDKQSSYSIGCVTIDPNNNSTIWVGTGENVGGRHTGFGDGIYVSYDAGKTWKNRGLKLSEHISKIVIHPTNPNILWVAAQGPLWSKGGERGIYKSINGGSTWSKTLGDKEWVGATDIAIDSRNPDVLYAATWQRHRTVASYLGGGLGSGIHKSIDGGTSWTKLTEGIPTSNLGKIGLAISHFDQDVVYAAIELDRKKGGVFMSNDAGASWVKQSDAVSGGTGPHYYQELYASPHHEGKLFFMSNASQISDDHGKTFGFMNENKKHVDSHAMAFKMSNPNYVIFGTDGGLYESFDLTKSWRYTANLPVTQFYKLAVDDALPFYNVYGGTQDNGSLGGPSRNAEEAGILNSDWWVTLGADGHGAATEPGNPNIIYGEYQEGWLWRIDKVTKDVVFIQPQPAEGEPKERFNWDAPILVSPHNPTRLYFASQRVWKSENRGDNWDAISKDLTRNQDRITLPIMGGKQSWDNAWDVLAMSQYNTITSLSESPKQEGLLYAGTDDGIIQVSEDGGANWTGKEIATIKGVPGTAFVNDIRADLFDPNVVYAALDNHKYGDYKPYLLKSNDKGKTWSSMNGNLPSKLITWRLVQDHVDKNLLFAATEFGIYFTKSSGTKWTKLNGGLPTISFRDITIQRRENDLVAASFGRGFYVLDDITPIREFDEKESSNKATLFAVKPAYWYFHNEAVYGQGNNQYTADNPPFGAIFNYYLPEKFKSLKETRQEREKAQMKNSGAIVQTSWEQLEQEKQQQAPEVLLTIRNANGKVVRVVVGTNEKGFNSVNWDLNYPDKNGEPLVKKPVVFSEWSVTNETMVTPGTYSVTLSTRMNGKGTELFAPMNFEVVPLEEGSLKGASYADINNFRNEFQRFEQDLAATKSVISQNLKMMDAMKRALDKAENSSSELQTKIYDMRQQLMSIEKEIRGSRTKSEIGQAGTELTPGDASATALYALKTSTYGPTPTHVAALNRGAKQLVGIKGKLKKLVDTDIPTLENELKATGAPWIEGQGLK